MHLWTKNRKVYVCRVVNFFKYLYKCIFQAPHTDITPASNILLTAQKKRLIFSIPLIMVLEKCKSLDTHIKFSTYEFIGQLSFSLY